MASKLLTKTASALAGVLLCVVPALAARQQATGTDPEAETACHEDSLRERIDRRSSTIETLGKKEVIDSLYAQTDDLLELVTILDNRLDALESTLNSRPEIDYSVWPLPLISDETSVFRLPNLKGREVPKVLQERYETVCLIADIASTLSATDAIIDDNISFATRNGLEPNELIQESIKDEIETLLDMFTRLKEHDISSLSDSQTQYIGNLKNHYNSYKKYYE